ncbi:hypothetical protein VTL71DRAFT_13626 [Oculimacula yallundae]|uniref:Pre-mRNA polyadenylation factor Fip1 domain-containing protein n=1 Tax=Oculimacula yallundae TaxID=86028 RepID=A0ABR4CLB2_9HELO
MDVDEDDDFYAPEDGAEETKEQPETTEAAPPTEAKPEQEDEDLEEGEEEDEEESDDSDSDIDIITERKDGTKAAPPSQPKYNEIRNISQRTTANEVVAKPTVDKKEKKGKDVKKGTPQISGADLPGVSTSKIDVNAKPIYEPAGKPITQVNIDEDLNENDKPWRRPGTDISDYFNYGFDEFTWALYASKQDSVRSEFSPEKMAANQKKMLDDMNMMMSMGAMPGMIPGAAGGAMPGMEGMTPEMLQQMQQMMGAGMDPSQMDPAMFGPGGAGGAQGGQNFGGQGFGQGQNQYGYDQGMANSGDNRNRGGNFGRGRGGRRGGGGW